MEKNFTKHEQQNDNINRLNSFMSAYFNWLIIFVVAIILIAGGMLVIRPKYIQAKTKVDLISQKMDLEYETLSKYLDRLKEVNGNYEEIKSTNISKIENFLPSDPEIEELYEKMELLAKSNGLLLSTLNITLQDVPDGPIGPINTVPAGVSTLKLSMNIAGVSYTGLKNFLTKLEKNLRLIDITNLSYDPNGESLTLEAVVYYKK